MKHKHVTMVPLYFTVSYLYTSTKCEKKSAFKSYKNRCAQTKRNKHNYQCVLDLKRINNNRKQFTKMIPTNFFWLNMSNFTKIIILHPHVK